MSTKRFASLIQIIVLTLGAVVAIAQPMRSYPSRQLLGGVKENLQISFLDFIFPNRRARTRGSRRPARDPFNNALPQIITPRNTALIRTNALTLQWQPVAGATSYTVEINGPGVDWEVEVTGTEAIYNELDSLTPNYRYIIIVTADNGISSKLAEQVGFQLLPETERERVNAQVDAIKAEQLGTDEEALAIALAYFEFEHSDPDWKSTALNQAAIDVLETRIQVGTEDSRVYLLQADTYLRIGLPLLAQERYEEALTHAQAAGQPELQAESHWGLGDVAQGETAYGDAIEHLQAAQTLYRDLGELEQVEELQTRIERLSREIPSS